LTDEILLEWANYLVLSFSEKRLRPERLPPRVLASLPSDNRETLGFRLIEVGPGTATMELIADTEIHANPMGTIHGGVFHEYWRAWRAEQEINSIGA